MGSILNEAKKALDLEEDQDHFDTELIMFINATLSTLNQLGVGPDAGFFISGPDQTWEQFIGDEARLNNAKAIMFYDVKLAFDPPSIGFVISAYERMRAEAVWRLGVQRNTIKRELEPEPDPPEEELGSDPDFGDHITVMQEVE